MPSSPLSPVPGCSVPGILHIVPCIRWAFAVAIMDVALVSNSLHYGGMG